MNLQEAIEFLDNQGYYLIKETHAEDDTLDWLCQAVYEYTNPNGIEWHYNWKRDGYFYVGNGIYEMYTVFDAVGEVKITIKDGEVTEIEPKKGGIYTPEEFAEEFGM